MGQAMMDALKKAGASEGESGTAGAGGASAGAERILFANSDLSGFSIFEEAQYRGIVSADRALRFLVQ